MIEEKGESVNLEIMMITVDEVWDRGWMPLPLYAVNRPAIEWRYLMEGDRDVRSYRRWRSSGFRFWGVVCGYSVYVVDVDNRDKRLIEMLEKQGVSEKTSGFVVRTARGMHFYYLGAGDEGERYDKCTGLWNQVDFIGFQGMVNLICPKREVIKDTGELTPLPRAVVERLRARARARKVKLARDEAEKSRLMNRDERTRRRYALSKLAGLTRARPGKRNAALNAVCWSLRGMVDEAWLEEQLWEVGQKLGLEEREIRATIRSGLGR